jgi:EpsI family protein
MPDNKPRPGFLRTRPAQVLTVLLILQALALYGFSRTESVPAPRPLADFPQRYGAWQLFQEGVMDKDTMDILRADDVLNRTYAAPGGYANLFVAFFKSQRAGQAPHSPKNCLPGSGWVPEASDIVRIEVPGRPQPIPVNRYLVQKGDEKSLVLYWYQSRDRVVANEYRAKFYVVADAIRYNRTDTALVRIVVPVRQGTVDEANRLAVDFIRDSFPLLKEALPL